LQILSEYQAIIIILQ